MVKLADIARRAGVSIFTVSCALRGQGRVAAETLARIREIAAEMGYQPSAAARALAEGRQRSHGEVRNLAIAAVRFGHNWNNPLAEIETRRMVAAAKTIGYELDVVYFEDFESSAQMSRVLWARGVVGLILLTSSAPNNWQMEYLEGLALEKFAVVKISRGFDDLKCHCVRSSVFSQTKVALEHIVAAGYRRIGVLMLDRSASVEDDFARVGAVNAFQYLRAATIESIELLRTEGPLNKLPPSVVAWLEELKPEVILGFPLVWRVWMELAGYRIPSDFAFVGLPVVAASESQTGIATSGPLDDFMGQTFPASLEMLHEEIANGRRGLPSRPYEHVLPVIWQEGVTMPNKLIRQ